MKRVLAAGCSFLHERGTVIPQCEVLCEQQGWHCDNVSWPGKGNFYIVKTVLDGVRTQLYDLVLIGWTSPLRWDYEISNGKTFSFKMQDYAPEKFNKPVDLERTGFYHWSLQVFLLSEFLRQRGQKFVMWNSLRTWYDGSSFYHDYIQSMPEFLEVRHSQIQDLEHRREWYATDDHHPNQQNHDRWAHKIQQHLDRTL